MWLLAARVGICALAFANQNSWNERVAMNRVQHSIVTATLQGEPSGVAVLISSTGLFVVSESIARGQDFAGQFGDIPLIFEPIAADHSSALALVQAHPWPLKGLTPIKVNRTALTKGQRLIAVANGEPIAAEFISDARLGVIRPSQRLVQLSEMRFERPLDGVSGAMVFTDSGALVGALAAVLDDRNQATGQNAQLVQPFTARGGGEGNSTRGTPFRGAFNSQGRVVMSNQFGPAPLTVGYTTTPAALQHAIAGFLSANHQVVHPYLGVFCRNDRDGGATIIDVASGSPASIAGLKVGDVIVGINTYRVLNQVDFARAMIDKHAGESLRVVYRRAGQVTSLIVVVGTAAD